MTPPLPFTKPQPQLKPRPYQRDAVDAVHAAAERGLRRVVVAMAAGTGKSLVSGYVVAERGGRAVVLAHRDELVRQLGQAMIHANPKADVGYVKAGENEVDSDIVIASVQTLCRPKRMAQLLASQDRRGKFVTVIQDEMHHILGGEDENTFGRVLRELGAFAEDGALFCGASATIDRGDNKATGNVWQEIVYRMSILDGISQGYLCELRGIQVQLKADFNQLHTRMGDFRDEESASMLMAADAPKHAAEAYLEHAAGRRALVFTPTIAVAQAMEDAFRAVGVPCEYASGEMDMEHRRAILRRLRTGETLVVPNAQIFGEGTDIPAVSCVIIARPTKSRPAAIQAVGRATRIYPEKSDAIVIDLVGTTLRKDLVTLAELFDVTPDEAKGGVAAATLRRKTITEAAEAAVDGRLQAVEVHLYDRSKFNWVSTGTERFTLSLGAEGSLVVEPMSADDDVWNISRIKRTRVPGASYPQNVADTVRSGITLETAQGIAEDMVRESGTEYLNDKKAKWRLQPPSEKQKAILVRRGKWVDGMTKGSASDELTKLFAAR